MTLYGTQKFLYQLNRDERLQRDYAVDRRAALAGYDLTPEEADALVEPDLGLLYVMGVNGQILMHFAALHGVPWTEHIRRLREGLERHGPVRTGLYRTVGS